MYRESRFSDAAFLIADGNVYRGDVHNTVKRFNNLRLGIAILRKWATGGKGDGVDRDSIDCHKEKYGMGGYKG